MIVRETNTRDLGITKRLVLELRPSNPWRASAARVTVVAVCILYILCVRPSPSRMRFSNSSMRLRFSLTSVEVVLSSSWIMSASLSISRTCSLQSGHERVANLGRVLKIICLYTSIIIGYFKVQELNGYVGILMTVPKA